MCAAKLLFGMLWCLGNFHQVALLPLLFYPGGKMFRDHEAICVTIMCWSAVATHSDHAFALNFWNNQRIPFWCMVDLWHDSHSFWGADEQSISSPARLRHDSYRENCIVAAFPPAGYKFMGLLIHSSVFLLLLLPGILETKSAVLEKKNEKMKCQSEMGSSPINRWTMLRLTSPK